MKKYYKIFFVLFILILISGCASVKAKKKEGIITGVEGIVVPVDDKGKEITQQDREKIIINIINMNNSGERENSVTINPNNKGEFFTKLKSGEYSIEVFLEGFYVKSFKVKVKDGEVTDLGRIYLKKIETESASPIKGGENIGTILNEGDVNIQPPAY